MPLGPFDPIPPREKVRREHINDLRAALTGVQDAYDVAVANGFAGTRVEWLQSLIGPQGKPGTVPVGSATTASALPMTGNTLGDVRTTDDTGHAHRWSGTAWIDIGQWRGPGGMDTELRARVDPGEDGEGGQFLSIGADLIIWHREPYYDVSHPRFGGITNDPDHNLDVINAAHDRAKLFGVSALYFPAMDYLIRPVGTTRSLRLSSNMTYRGDGYASRILVAPDSGDYQAIFYPATAGTRIENVVFRGLRFDQNAAAQTVATVPLGGGAAQNAIRAHNVRNLTVDGCWFDDCTGVNTVNLNGSGYTDVGDYRVQNSTFVWRRLPNATNPTPEHRAYDNSAIYLVGESAVVTGNTFFSPITAGVPEGARGCCEFHGPRMVYANNISSGYQTLINLGGLNANWSEAEWIVEGNIGRNLNTGIRALCGALPASNDRIRITNNTLHLDTGLHGLVQGAGILVTGGATSGEGTLELLDVSHNDIKFVPDTRTTTWQGMALSVPTYFVGIGLSIGNTVRGGRITDNTVINAPIYALILGAPGADYRALTVQRNTLDTPGWMDTWSSRFWIRMQGDFTDCEIADNQLIDTRDAGTNQRVWLNAQNLGTARNTWVDRNWRKDTGVGNWSSTSTYQPAGTWDRIFRTYSRATLDPPSIAAGAEWTTTIPHGGARLGDGVVTTPNGTPESGLLFWARVSTDNTLTLHLRNISASPVDPVSRVWRFNLIRTQQQDV